MHFEPLPNATRFIDSLCKMQKNIGKRAVQPSTKRTLSILINHFTCFSVLTLASVCVMTLGICSPSQLSLFCRRNFGLFDDLLSHAIAYALSFIPSGNLSFVIDDTDRPRSKIIKALSFVFKTRCKKTSGYHYAQNIVLVCAVTRFFTFPLAWAFYMPDPTVSKWNRQADELKKRKCCKGIKANCCQYCDQFRAELGECPKRDSEKYPTRLELAIALLGTAKKHIDAACKLNKELNILSISLDAAYLSPALLKAFKALYPKAQIISQLKGIQIVCDRKLKPISVKDYFQNKIPLIKNITIRGKDMIVEYMYARILVKSHGEKLLIIAMRYQGEKEYRYLAASKLTWRSEDVIRHYGLRWLVEVDIADWKQHSGFGKGACLQGDDGASCVLGLSLLGVFLFLTHPMQIRLLRSGQPLCTVGSLSQRLYVDFLMHNVGRIVMSADPKKSYEQAKAAVDEAFSLRSSKKHAGAAFGYPEFDESKSLNRRFGLQGSG